MAQVVALDVGSKAVEPFGHVGAVGTLDVPGGKVCVRHQIWTCVLGLGDFCDRVFPTVDHPPFFDCPETVLMGGGGVSLEVLGVVRQVIARGAKELLAIVSVKVPVKLLVPIQIGGLRTAVFTRQLFVAQLARNGVGFVLGRLLGRFFEVNYKVTCVITKFGISSY